MGDIETLEPRKRKRKRKNLLLCQLNHQDARLRKFRRTHQGRNEDALGNTAISLDYCRSRDLSENIENASGRNQ
jgi:hypothetical protein